MFGQIVMQNENVCVALNFPEVASLFLKPPHPSGYFVYCPV
jgi:hypothetical protein